jgi:CRISPR system Cascade subunit CasE
MFLTKLDLNLKTKSTANWLKNPYNVHIDLWKAFTPKKNDGDPQPFLYRFDLNQKATIIQPRILVLSNEKPDWDRSFQDNQYLSESPAIKELSGLDFIKEGALFRFSLLANPTQKIVDYRKLFKEELKNYPETYSRKQHKEYLEGKKKLKELVEQLRKTNPAKLDAFRLEKKENNPKQFKNMKKVGIYEESEQINWLRGERNNTKLAEDIRGFELLEAKVQDKEGKPGTLFSAYSDEIESRFIEILKKDKFTKENLSPIKLHTVHFSGILRVTNASAFKRAYTNGIGSGKAFGCGMLLLARV